VASNAKVQNSFKWFGTSCANMKAPGSPAGIFAGMERSGGAQQKNCERSFLNKNKKQLMSKMSDCNKGRFGARSKLIRKVSSRVPYKVISLNEDIKRLHAIWRDKVQQNRERDAVYIYLTAVYEVVSWWNVDGRAVERARRALKITGAFPVEEPEPFAAVIAASISPRRLDRRQLSKYSRVLRFAQRLNCHPSELKRLVKDRCGGLNACATRFTSGQGRR
jgi:hypothetical protein